MQSRLINNMDVPERSIAQRTSDEDNLSPKHNISGMKLSAAKVSIMNLPQEYQLARVLADVKDLHKSWSTETPACKWAGVKCNERGEVTYIAWEFSGRPNLKYLPRSLVHLYLWRNMLTGCVELVDLPIGLEMLNLSHNRFNGEVDLTSLPPNLRGLYLGYNMFTGQVCVSKIPTSIRNLYLQENAFSGCFDLTSLPTSIRNVSLDHNHFSGKLHLDHLPPNIITLQLSSNLFSGDVCLTRLPMSIDLLDLSNCPDLSGAVSRSALPVQLQNWSDKYTLNTQIYVSN